ncbi:MAG: hypothetical protein MI923_22455 [Phycisphaerales bacterium]|nr:hypothetical protein [Phycisphaerales bacterium]
MKATSQSRSYRFLDMFRYAEREKKQAGSGDQPGEAADDRACHGNREDAASLVRLEFRPNFETDESWSEYQSFELAKKFVTSLPITFDVKTVSSVSVVLSLGEANWMNGHVVVVVDVRINFPINYDAIDELSGDDDLELSPDELRDELLRESGLFGDIDSSSM